MSGELQRDGRGRSFLSVYSIFVLEEMYYQLGGRGLFGLISDGHILLYFQSFDINKEDNYDEQTSVCGSRLKRVWLPSGRSCWSSTRRSSLTDGDLGVKRCVYRREETLSRDGTFIKAWF